MRAPQVRGRFFFNPMFMTVLSAYISLYCVAFVYIDILEAVYSHGWLRYVNIALAALMAYLAYWNFKTALQTFNDR